MREKEGKKFSFSPGMVGSALQLYRFISVGWSVSRYGNTIATLVTVSNEVAFVIRIGFILWLFSTGLKVLSGGGPS
ncbi:MAG: hypothetical protein IH935_12250 [Acidobacteria bacterium]|nr:hypothetical protein [Acidobacteriota bacterium]MCH8269039.1 hypothetical protein [Acidobacteriota bacterium]MCZ6490752.1 hypothetical protein [Acidobacteriota bacterium]MCZ6751626.1 hypothetical protein [Acidobacteriota bacterium]